MRRIRAIAIAAAIVVVAAPARSDGPLPTVLQVLGTVTNSARPVANALVIALNTQDLHAVQTYTARDGAFTLPQLPAGMYKIIAAKAGFIPAIATVVPTRANHRVALKLESENTARRKSATQEIWEIRGSLPPDVLRELDNVLASNEIVSYEIPRFRGEMVSLTGVTNRPANPSYAQTSVGVQGRVGDTWQVGIRGNLRRFEDPTDEVRFGPPVAESSVMSMEVRSSPTDAYRVASTKSTWMYVDGAGTGDRQVDVRAHNFEWTHGPAHVQVRYFEQDNLFRHAPLESNVFEIAGDVPIVQTRRNDFGVGLRVRQESVETASDLTRTADVSANGTLSVAPSLLLHYGVASRIGVQGQEWAPRTGAEWKMTENMSFVGSALVKVYDRNPSTVMLPNLVVWSENDRMLPKYTYTFGFVSGKDGQNRFSVLATITAVDEPLRVVFADEQDQFWDGLYVDSGDIRRDVRLAYRKQFGNRFAVDVAGTAGTASSHTAQRNKIYVTGDLQSTFTPTRTALMVSYREIQQPGDAGTADYRTERVHVQMAQSLYLPVDIKLLLGVELAHAVNSPYLIDTFTPEGSSRKYIGGLAVNF
jgi:hypothetical protein